MDIETIKQSLQSITDKIGEEQAAKIADDIGLINVTINQGTDLIKAKEDRIKELETANQQYIAANASLLKRIPLNEENKLVPRLDNQTQTAEPPKDPFDEWGRLKK